MHIEAVIGANYGDEGKGLFTEYLCRNRPSPLVVLSNGGCQRGHTVNNVEHGIRHVFHHFGSGTLLNVPSVFSKTFLLNPIKYIEEKKELESIGIKPTAFRAPGCLVQLPCDMLTNQAIERARGFGRHGSCGWGIWETKVRNSEHALLSFEQFASYDCKKKMATYLDCLEWQIENRLKGVYAPIYAEELSHVKDNGFIAHFIKDFEDMAREVKALDSDSLLEADLGICGFDAETLVVECGQGLLLDKKYAPIDENGSTDIHTTPSSCGMVGAVDAVGDGIDASIVTANYVSRTYFTRHGAGPFPEEDASVAFKDETNISNEYQGSLRFGKIDETSAAQLLIRIAYDALGGCVPNANRYNLVMTHCNEAMPSAKAMSHASFFSFEDDSRKFLRRSDMFKK